jgi:hypothetical protein
MQNARSASRRAQFQLWIFSYTRERVIVKKMAVKTLDWTGSKTIASVWKIRMGDLFASISSLAYWIARMRGQSP